MLVRFKQMGMVILLAGYCQVLNAAGTLRPNIIFILADDLGYGDLSAYGATDIHTPNIDRLAREGIRFTDHYTPANTCSPSRAALMTGRYPSRTGVNAVLSYDTVEGLPLQEITLAELLRDAGYTTAMIGKWHLGQVEALMPWRQGFESFFGVATSNDDNNFFLYESTGIQYQRIPQVVDQTALTQQYTSRALTFLQQQAGQSKPFFLYLAPSAPHVPLHPHPGFVGSSKRGIYGDVVQELDNSVGQLLNQLTQLEMDDNTLVIFTSDNGAWRTMREYGGNNGVLREGKLTTFEGGHRVPALVRWPQRIPSGQVNSEVATMMDWFVTLAQYAGAGVPADRMIDGESLQAVLEGRGSRKKTPFFYFALRPPHETQVHRLAAVRSGPWKLKTAQTGYYPHFFEPLMKVGLYRHSEMLFNLENDPGETRDVRKENPQVADNMRRMIADFESANPMPVPVNINAAPKDDAGWEQLWRGIILTLALVIFLAVMVWVILAKLLRRYQKWSG